MFMNMNTSMGGPIIVLDEGDSLFAVVVDIRETSHRDMKGYLVDCVVGDLQFSLNGHTALVKGLRQGMGDIPTLFCISRGPVSGRTITYDVGAYMSEGGTAVGDPEKFWVSEAGIKAKAAAISLVTDKIDSLPPRD
jgi:hypothetical protein